MSIEKMEFLTIVGVMKDLDKSLAKCVESGCFHMAVSFILSIGAK